MTHNLHTARRWRTAALTAVLACGTMFAAACGDDDTPPTQADGDFTFAVSPTTLTIAQGESAPVTATVTRTGGFAGAITGTVEGLPAGVTLTPLSIATGSNTGQVTVSVASTAAAGTYTITVKANGTGVAEKTATVNLTVTEVAQPTLSITLNPASLSIAAGAMDSSLATVTRGGGFTGALTLAAAGAPTGVTVTTSAIAADNTTSRVVVTVDSTVAPGSYAVTLTATGTGVADATSMLTVNVVAAAGYEVSFTPDSLDIAPGAQDTTSVGISRSGGFTGALTFAVDSTVPSGITVTLPSAPVAGDTASLTVAVSDSVAAGTYSVSINISGTDVPAQTKMLTIVVPDLGGLTLTATPASPSLTQGQSTPITIGIARTAPFTAPVTFAVTGLPAGVTAAIQPDSAAGDSAVLTLTAANAAALGTANVKVLGSGGGVTSDTLTIPVMVVAGTGGGTGNVTYSFCADDSLPVYVAYQDGTGDWMRATAGADSTYTFDIASGKGGVAVVRPSTGTTTTSTVMYGTVAELNGMGMGACTTPATPGRSFTGTVAGTGLTDFVSIVAGGATATVAPAGSVYSLMNVSNDPFDLLASRFAVSAMANAKFIIRRNLNPANNSALAVLDFSAPEAFDPVARTVTIGNGLGENLTVFAQYVLTGGASGGAYFTGATPSDSTVRTWYGVPDSMRAAGDLHLLGVTAVDGGLNQRSRTLLTAFGAAVDQTVSLPAALVGPTVVNAGTMGGNAQLRATYQQQADYDSYWSVEYAQTGTNGSDITVTKTKDYVASTGPVVLETPNLTALADWNTNWGIVPGTPVTWVFVASGWDTGFGLGSSTPVAGSQSRTATAGGDITP